MSIPNTFRHYFRRIAPKAYRSVIGDKKMGVLSLLWDELADGARQAVRLSLPNGNEGPTDALPYLSREFGGIPWVVGESEESYRAGLAALDTAESAAPGVLDDGSIPDYAEHPSEAATGVWRRQLRRGSVNCIVEELARCGIYARVEQSADYDSDVFPSGFDFGFSAGFTPRSKRYRYRVRVYGYGPWEPPYDYGLAPPYGSGWCYGTRLPIELVTRVVAVCRYWGPARSRLEHIRSIDGGFSYGFDTGFDSVYVPPMGFNCAFAENAF